MAHVLKKEKTQVGLLLLSSLILGNALGTILWSKIPLLPFSNPLEVVGPLALAQYNPANTLLRYLVYIFSPAVAYFLLRRLPFFHLSSITPAVSLEKMPLRWRFFFSIFLGLWLVCTSLLFLKRSFSLGNLDFFHDGEFLAPAYHYAVQHTLWLGSYFVHGAFEDPLITFFSWKLFGVTSIGASRLLRCWISGLIPGSFLFLIFSLTRLLRLNKETYSSAFFYLLALGAWASTENKIQVFYPRDIFVLVGLGCFFLGLSTDKSKWNIPFILAGGIVPLTFFHSIERGAYYGVTCFLTFIVLGRFRALIPWFLGLVTTSACALVLFGSAEMLGFLKSTLLLFQTKELFDSYIYPRPTIKITAPHTLVIFLISIQILLLSYFWDQVYSKKKEYRFFGIHLALTLLAIFYYRGALGRSDIFHLRYASSFACLGLFFPLWIWFSQLKIKKPRLREAALGGSLCVLTAALIPSLGQISTVFKTEWMQTPHLPDDFFLSKKIMKVKSEFEVIFQNEKCFFSMTSEPAWVYLLRKPSCSRFYAVWFATPRPLRDELLSDLKRTSPQYLLFDSPQSQGYVDGVTPEQRFPELIEYIHRHYLPFRDIDGWKILKKI